MELLSRASTTLILFYLGPSTYIVWDCTQGVCIWRMYPRGWQVSCCSFLVNSICSFHNNVGIFSQGGCPKWLFLFLVSFYRHRPCVNASKQCVVGFEEDLNRTPLIWSDCELCVGAMSRKKRNFRLLVPGCPSQTTLIPAWEKWFLHKSVANLSSSLVVETASVMLTLIATGGCLFLTRSAPAVKACFRPFPSSRVQTMTPTHRKF